ncbi:MAG TPA: type II toxin-antitoxin system RelE/ParE family toxin [bacterium]|nr:type II toxin-antitoxin system RelE/ParE family toxin [bacterium]
MAYLIRQYHDASGVSPVDRWIRGLDKPTISRVLARIDRLAGGNFGQSRHLGAGVHEAKMDFGPGYRLYFGVQGSRLILLLCGGDKSSQASDIQKARRYWAEYKGGQR